MPSGSTPLDFAFKIHTAVGCKCVGAKVNGKMVTIDHQLNNGDIVEIITSSNSSGPSIDWLKMVKSSHARNKIRQWLKKENKSDDVDRGKDALDKMIRKRGYEPHQIAKAPYLNKAMKEMNIATLEELYAQISRGGTLLSKLVNLLAGYFTEDKRIEQKKEEEKHRKLLESNERKEKIQRYQRENPGIVVKGMDGLMIRVSRCCNPVPGDDIVGFITKGRGISVHRKDCSNVISLPEEEKARFIDVEWEDLKFGKSYNTDICIVAADRKGILADLSRVCEDMDVHISGVNAKSGKDGLANITMTLSITSTHQIQRLLRQLRQVQSVSNVFRARA